MTTQPRQEEIKTTLTKYEDYYRIAGGLLVILTLIIIGGLIFGQNPFGFEGDFLGYITNVATELLSVIGTVIVVDQLNRRRTIQERKIELFDQAKSRSNDMAVDALEKIQRAGWWNEMLAYSTKDHRVDLRNLQWAGGIQLVKVNLTGAFLFNANLANAVLEHANLTDANLRRAKLIGANLVRTDLTGAVLELATLTGAFLLDAKLDDVKWSDNDGTEAATLPDGTTWTADTDMKRFSDAAHDDFETTFEAINQRREEMGLPPIRLLK